MDRWITSRFQRCLATVEEAVAVYDFTAAVDALYHFVWDEFCDWYVELIKVPLYGEDEAKKAQAAGHARWMLDQIVRLLHPFMPFVTEEIAAQYGAAPLLRQQHPRRDEARLAPDDEQAIGELQAAVDALRRFRAEAEIPPGKVLAAVFAGDAGAADALRAVRGRLPRPGPHRPRLRRASRRTDATVVIVPGGRLLVAAGDRQGRGDRPSRAAARQGAGRGASAARPSSATRSSSAAPPRPWWPRSARSWRATSPSATAWRRDSRSCAAGERGA